MGKQPYFNKFKFERTPEVVYGIRNFIGNSIKFSKNLTTVSVESDNDTLSVIIDDDGLGFPNDILDILGEPYIKSKIPSSSSGLGLGTFLGKTLLNRKNAEVPNEVILSGFGFTEVGTVTPLGQAGNEPPRVFRLPEDDALINRLGFNNDGMEIIYDRLSKTKKSGTVGINIGANKDTKDRLSDYQIGIKKFSTIADYITINISSPNTPGLRDLQSCLLYTSPSPRDS